MVAGLLVAGVGLLALYRSKAADADRHLASAEIIWVNVAAIDDEGSTITVDRT